MKNVKLVDGPTVCTVPAYVEIDRDQRASAFVHDIEDETSLREKFDFIGLANISKITANAHKACQFGTLIVVQGTNGPLDAHENIGRWTTMPHAAPVTSDSLSLDVFMDQSSTKVVANYDTRVIAESTVKMLVTHLFYVMGQLIKSNEDQRVRDIKLFTPEDQGRIWSWNSSVPLPTERCAHDWICDQAQARPDAPAISAWNGALTYRELDSLSTALAHRLISLGINPGALVPLCFEKSVWVSVAILAVLKAGGAFLMIDPAHPESRLRSIVEQTDAELVLTSASHLSLGSRLASHAVAVDAGVISERPDNTELPRISPSSPMYVVFTSGSTGVPKGVLVSHAAFASNISYQADQLGFGSSSRIYDFANHIFDDFIYYTITALVKGGCVCVPSEKDRTDDLMGSIIATGATMLYITTSVSRLLDPAKLSSIKTVVAGAEAVTLYDTRRWWGYAKLINAYGPTECTTNTVINIDAKSPEAATRIGKGAGVITWIVDPADHNKLMPIGMIGELLLEGPLLGLGYLNDPEKTAAAFIRDPPWLLEGSDDQPGRHGTLYKTGDLVHYNGDGSLTYIGRKDTQVKIRGQRVELSEVEYQVRMCVPLAQKAEQIAAEVIMPSGDGASPILAVFLSDTMSRTEDLLTALPIPEEVEDNLAEKLPNYMMPTVMFTISHMPMTSTGKIDRKKLCEMAASFSAQQLADLHSQNQDTKRMPSTDIEQRLQQLWAHVLNIEPLSIGLDDSFFRLGGDSISAMKLVSEGRRDQLQLSVADIFRNPKLVTMAQSILERELVSIAASTSPILPFSLLRDTPRDTILAGCNLDAALIEDIYPCTPLQQGLFALTTKRQGDYMLQSVLELSGHVDIDRLCASWEEAAQAFAILRTRIVQHIDLGLFQAVIRESIDWTYGDDLDEYLKTDKSIPMELGQPLVRYGMVRDTKTDRNWFIWTLHHAVYDGSSLPLVLDLVYNIYRGSQPERLTDFRAFIQHSLQSIGIASTQYWQSQFSGYQSIPFPQLPPTLFEPVADSKIEHICVLPTAEKSDFTLATVARASWAIVANRLTDMPDVVFGAIVSGRNAALAGIEEMVGPTIATVPVRIQVQPQQSIRDYLQAVQDHGVEMIPFEQTGLQDIAKVSPEARRACSLQTLLVVQPPDEQVLASSILGQWHVNSDDSAFSTYAMTLSCYLRDDDVKLEAVYDSRVVEHWKMKKMIEQFGFIMQKLLHLRQTDKVGDITILTPQDQEELWKWNTAVPVAVEHCAHVWISDQAQIQPDAPAISAWDGALTYRELDSLSTALARRLVSLGIAPGALVPLCFEKSMWVSVAILAVLKAGGAFLMIDPTHPESRLRSIVERTDTELMLTSTSHLPLCSRLVSHAVAIGAGAIPDGSENIELPRVSPSSPMYAVFTSGSTGVPKGALVSHAAFASNISYQADQLGFDSSLRVYDFANHIFDDFLYYTIAALVKGGCICVPSENDRTDNLMGSIIATEATMLYITTSVSRLLDPAKLSSVKTVVIGAEAVTLYDTKRWWGYAKLINAYGPAECTTNTVINIGIDSPEAAIRIGKGAGVVTWIVDPTDHNKLMPIGMIGELLLEGPLLGLGYLKDPEKTAAAFIRDPPWLLEGSDGQPGRHGTLYKTGDLVQYSSDGSLTYIGRKDTQVKIRGQRVELGEVEYQVRACVPQAQNADQIAAEVIMPSGDGASPVLAVFLSDATSTTDGSLTALPIPNEVEDSLVEKLPSYMIPAVMFTISHMPMTSTGKIDRKKLCEMAASFSAQQLAELRGQNQETKRMPSTDIEQKLQQLWARILNIDPLSIGLDDSFFHLGGDSITAMQISSTARSLKLSITTADILRQKTIRRILHSHPVLFDNDSLSATSTVEPLNQPFGLSPIQTLYFQTHPDGRICDDQHFFLELVDSMITPVSLSDALSALVQRHSILRARFRQNSEGIWQQYISAASNACLRVNSIECDGSLSVIAGAISRCRASLDIENGPLLAATLMTNDKDKKQSLFITIHHLVIDLVSWRILLQELEDLLLSRPLLSASALSFQTWCGLQAEYTATRLHLNSVLPLELHPNKLSYWGLEPGIALSGNIATERFVLNAHDTDALLNSCNAAYQTRPHELLIGALIYSFSVIFPDRPAPPIFNETHGREAWDDVDLSQTVGWFTSMFPVQVSHSSRSNLLQVIRETKDCMRSFPDNGWSYFASHLLNQPASYSPSSPGSMFPVEVLFNYAGRFQQLEHDETLFKMLPIPEECDDDLNKVATGGMSLFDISVVIEEGCAHVSMSYDRDIKLGEKVTAWAKEYEAVLTQMVRLLISKAAEWTLSDFPLAFRSYDDLDTFQTITIPSLDIKAEDVEDVFPCSAMQQGILVSQASDPTRYRSYDLLEVTSPHGIDCDQLQRAWRAVARQHPLLRAFVVDGIPGSVGFTHVVLRDPEPNMSFSQVTGDTVDVEQLRARYAATAYQQPTSLQYHLAICQLDKDRVFIHLYINHAIEDAHARGLILRDLQAAYDDKLHHHRTTFRDVVSYLQSQSLDEARNYWAQHLQSAEPCYFPAMAGPGDGHGLERMLEVPELNASDLHTFCKRWDLTPATVIQTTWAIVLSRYSGCVAPCFGNITSGRDLPIDHVNDIAGPLICMLTYRVPLDTHSTVLETLRYVQDNYMRSLTYQTFPLAEVHKVVGPTRSPLFNTALSLQRAEEEEDDSGDYNISFKTQDSLDPNEVGLRTLHRAIRTC
jgi:amino acid adenylation domain-containing protein/non-ribosomal peptide synthase protein (TIGR01720 family)